MCPTWARPDRDASTSSYTTSLQHVRVVGTNSSSDFNWLANTCPARNDVLLVRCGRALNIYKRTCTFVSISLCRVVVAHEIFYSIFFFRVNHATRFIMIIYRRWGVRRRHSTGSCRRRVKKNKINKWRRRWFLFPLVAVALTKCDMFTAGHCRTAWNERVVCREVPVATRKPWYRINHVAGSNGETNVLEITDCW